MMGIAKFLVDKEAGLRLDFDDPRESSLVKGKFIRAENVEGKKEMVALAMEFDDAVVPMGYKIRINEFLNTVRADSRTGGPAVETGGVKGGKAKAGGAEEPAVEETEPASEAPPAS